MVRFHIQVHWKKSRGPSNLLFGNISVQDEVGLKTHSYCSSFDNNYLFVISTITIGESLQIFSGFRVPEFSEARDGHNLAARALDKILLSIETTQSENAVSAEFFDKYFSKDDLVERNEEEKDKKHSLKKRRHESRKRKEKKITPELNVENFAIDQSNNMNRFGPSGFRGFDGMI